MACVEYIDFDSSESNSDDDFRRYERKKPCPGPRELERIALVGTDRKRALDGENMRRELKKGTWSEIGVERKERR
ncbi:hypothetical protein TNCV_4083881 [Trichonephila clavipes]|nr:hypothetical protein TNCV_4083881 [Trichonephila clavipes]